ncbi:MAG: endopeptidase La [Deltaproteobacteria bacterium]|jgi:ATP-dependent Lon protease|nr:endopeptidase La [Deltaproteobacteria bacterium]
MKRVNDHKHTISPLPAFNPDLDFHPDLDDAGCADLPETLRLLPMVDLNLFPGLVSNICVEDPAAVRALSDGGADPCLALFTLRNISVDPDNLLVSDFHPVGVAARILAVTEAPTPGGPRLKVAARGLCRLSISEMLPGPQVRVSRLAEPLGECDGSVRPLAQEAGRLFAEAVKLIPGTPVNLFKIQRLLDGHPGVLADLIMASLPLKTDLKAEYMGLDSLKDRFLRLLEHLTLEVASRRAGRAVTARMETQLGKRFKEQQLREQMRAIRAELGDEEGDDVSRAAARLEAASLPPAARAAADRELSRLRITPPQSAEHAGLRNYLDWLAEMPWADSETAPPDIAKARETLERDHHGLDAVKKRVLEFLAVHKLTGGLQAPVLCLAGPPGVGKTSLAKSVASALGRKLACVSLGGVRDEAEIRGHRRSYLGSGPGRIIAALRRCGVNNPVFLLDEVDKMGRGPAGDPGAALLEALDREQNEGFTDHFLEVPFDLSKAVFILTANNLDDVPPALLDRLEVVEIPGHTLDEKVEIAKKHLWPKELARHGLTPADASITSETVEALVGGYTWEAGCRDLARRLGALARERAMAKAEGREKPPVVTPGEAAQVLGPPRRPDGRREQEPQVGVVTGLAWTACGGDLMFVEAVAMPGQGRLSLTGRLGEVMRESAQAAICHVRSRAGDWFLRGRWFQENDVHIHLPHGAVPKDGPSAGVALATAVVSLVSGQKVRPEVAMTGEITLRGLVLPVGGLRDKLLAAGRAGLTTVLIPADNVPDLRALGPKVTAGLEIVPVSTLDEVLERALLAPEGLIESAAYSPGDPGPREGARSAGPGLRSARRPPRWPRPEEEPDVRTPGRTGRPPRRPAATASADKRAA